jgi:hypothetical protein
MSNGSLPCAINANAEAIFDDSIAGFSVWNSVTNFSNISKFWLPQIPMCRYRIEVGNNNNVKPGNILGSIANEADMDSEYIGSIQIFDDCVTFFIVSFMVSGEFFAPSCAFLIAWSIPASCCFIILFSEFCHI